MRGDQEVIWVVDAAGDGGFRPATGAGAQRDPRVAGERAAWIEDAPGGALVRVFDLATGAARTLARGDIAPGGFDISDDALIWIDGAHLRRRALSPTAAPPEPQDPEPAGADAGFDAGALEPDAG